MMNCNEKIKKYNRLINIMCWCATTFCLLEAIIMFVDIGTNFSQTLPWLYIALVLMCVLAILICEVIEIVSLFDKKIKKQNK